ncbi:MAG TPA: 50S ribosomal protein L21 [Anaerolineales bacterium]
MRYAIIESGGKQYRAVEGETLEVDRLPDDTGKQINLERILLVADGDTFQVGTPVLGGIEVKATIVDHFSGPKVIRFRYSPKKRIRVRGGHRQQYTRLKVDFIGGKGEVRKVEKAEPVPAPVKEASGETPKKAVQKEAAAKKRTGAKPAVKKSAK